MEPPTLKLKAPGSHHDIQIPFTPPRPRPTLGTLPRNVRLLIYHHVLVETSRWTKRHTPFCKFCPTKAGIVERPPAVMYSVIHRSNGEEKFIPHCACARRQGMSLMTCSRAIQADAAPVFWGENVFLFDSVALFLHDVQRNLREEYRQLIRHIVICPEPWPRHPYLKREPKPRQYDNFWKAVFQCKSLRTLEVYHDLIVTYGHNIRNIAKELPHFEALRFCKMIFRAYSPPSGPLAGHDPKYEENPMLFFRLAQVVEWEDFQGLGEDEARALAREVARSFRHDTLRHFDTAVCAALQITCGSDIDSFWQRDSQPDYPLKAAHALSEKPDINFQNAVGAEYNVHVSGLSASPKFRMKNARRKKLNEEMRAAGLGGVPEKRLWNEYYEAREMVELEKELPLWPMRLHTVETRPANEPAWKKKEVKSEPEVEVDYLEERRQRNIEREKMERGQLITVKKKERRNRQKAMESLVELKKTERKRENRRGNPE